MQLLGLAGGAPSGAAELGCCVFPLLPLVAVLTMLAVHRNAAWPAALALVLVGLPCLVLWGAAADTRPSDDWEVMDEREAARKMAVLYSCLGAVVGLSLCLVIGVRLLGPPREPAAERSGVPPAPPHWGWLRRRAGWWVVLAAILALIAALAR